MMNDCTALNYTELYCKNIRTFVDALVLQWGQIKTCITIYNNRSPVCIRHLFLFIFTPNDSKICVNIGPFNQYCGSGSVFLGSKPGS